MIQVPNDSCLDYPRCKRQAAPGKDFCPECEAELAMLTERGRTAEEKALAHARDMLRQWLDLFDKWATPLTLCSSPAELIDQTRSALADG
jgi:hypothetical protein